MPLLMRPCSQCTSWSRNLLVFVCPDCHLFLGYLCALGSQATFTAFCCHADMLLALQDGLFKAFGCISVLHLPQKIEMVLFHMRFNKYPSKLNAKVCLSLVFRMRRPRYKEMLYFSYCSINPVFILLCKKIQELIVSFFFIC